MEKIKKGGEREREKERTRDIEEGSKEEGQGREEGGGKMGSYAAEAEATAAQPSGRGVKGRKVKFIGQCFLSDSCELNSNVLAATRVPC